MRRAMRGKARWSKNAAAGLLALVMMAAPGMLMGVIPGARAFAAVARNGRAAHGRVSRTKKRLILKDGTYRDVVKYKVRDGRVRYLSAEDGAWREIPASMVDWAATKKWEREHPHGVSAGEGEFENISPAEAAREEAEIEREEEAQRAAVKYLMPYVKPGLRLPDEDGIFALDIYHGEPELVHLQQADGDLNQNPFDSVQAVDVYRMHAFREVVQMQGVDAAVQMHVSKPVFYVSVHGAPVTPPANAFVVKENVPPPEPGMGGSAHSRFVIVRVVRQGASRVLFAEQLRDVSEPDPSGGRILTEETLLPGGHWMKVTPRDALFPGEYALVELLPAGEVNRDVWDFGVNPSAPENQQVRLPVEPGR